MTLSLPRSVCCIALVGLVLLTGCSSSSNSSSDSDFSMTVTPSLGLIRGADVRVLDLDGIPIDGASGTLGTDGSVQLTLPAGLDQPLIIEVTGNATAEYFDEASASFLPFGVGQTLRAVIAGPRSSVGVTPLTEVAAARALATSATTAEAITAINTAVRDEFLPGIADITAIPTLIDDAADAVGVGTDADLYALYLATLSELAAGQTASILQLTQQIADDFSDGEIDNAVGGVAIVDAVIDTLGAGFDALLAAAQLEAIAAFADSSLSVDELQRAFEGTNMLAISGTIANADNLPGQWQLFLDSVLVNQGSLASGAVTFTTEGLVTDGKVYGVSTSNEFCTVTNSQGVVDGDEITNVVITCVDSTANSALAISGNIANADGLSGQWELRLDGVFANDGPLTAGAVTFTTEGMSTDGMAYAITVSNEFCTVENGAGTVSGRAIANVAITCTDPSANSALAISGSIANTDNLTGQWELFLDGGFANDGPLSDGAVTYTFEGLLTDGKTYEVRPSNDNCTVENGQGQVNGSAITNVVITCTAPSSTTAFSISGSISNADNLSGQWELFLDGALSNDGQLTTGAVTYTFDGLVTDGKTYEVRPSNQSCTVENGQGVVNGSAITNVVITCSDPAANAAIAGVWTTSATDNDLLAFVFFADGTYVHLEVDEQAPIDNAGETSGMEWGTFSRNGQTGQMTVSQVFDANGDTGLTSNANEGLPLFAQISADGLTLQFDDNQNGTIENGESLEFTKLASNGLVGVWTNDQTDNELLALIFFGDGTYVHMEVDEVAPIDRQGEPSGMEWGTYTRDAQTGQLTVTQTFDANGDTGFTDSANAGIPFFAQVAGDVLTLQFDDNQNGTIDDGESIDFQRR